MPVDDYRPPISDVGKTTPTRTVDASSVQTGTFTATTSPTDAQAGEAIDQALSDVSLAIGADIPEVLWDDAIRLTALRAAMYIELDYYPEQTADPGSLYVRFKNLYDERLAMLLNRISALLVDTGDTTLDSGMPVFNFPVSSGSIMRGVF